MERFKIFIGIFVAGMILWILGAVFCNSPFILVPHEELQTMGYPAGSRIVWRTEGWGAGRFGKWWISAIPDIESRTEKKIILWGDSYVEAHQVDDGKRMAQQLTGLLNGCGETNFLAVSAGLSGQSVADYLTKIPVYEKMVPSICAHVIVIGQIEDFFPNHPPAHFSRFIATPEPHITPARLHRPSRVKWLVYQWGRRLRANGALSLLRNCSNGMNLRFSMGPLSQNMTVRKEPPSNMEIEQWFNFYAKAFRRTTDKPLILVYLPTVPRLEGNSWSFADENQGLADQMERVFTAAGWSVINMRDHFIQEFRSADLLPRGFPNSKPGAGHLNDVGHHLVADALAESLVKNGGCNSLPITDNK